MNENLGEMFYLFNWFDWTLVNIIGISTVYGLFRGFVKEAVTVTAWALAIWLAYLYADPLSAYLLPEIETESMRVSIVVLAVFVAVLMCSSFIRSGVRYIIDKVGLGGLDYLLGALFGILRGLVISMVLMVVLMNLGFSHDDWWKKSQMVKKIGYVMEFMTDYLPDDTKDIYTKYALPEDDSGGKKLKGKKGF